GPPSVAPNWLNLSGGGSVVAKKFFDWNRSLRRNSQPDPCHSFVPDLVTTLTTDPELRPNSAEKLLLWILNSWTASTFGRASVGFTRVSWFTWTVTGP